jgi:hypothetical protein
MRLSTLAALLVMAAAAGWGYCLTRSPVAAEERPRTRWAALRSEQREAEAIQDGISRVNAELAALDSNTRPRVVRLVQEGMALAQKQDAWAQDAHARLGLAQDVAIVLSGSEWVR